MVEESANAAVTAEIDTRFAGIEARSLPAARNIVLDQFGVAGECPSERARKPRSCRSAGRGTQFGRGFQVRVVRTEIP